MNKAIYTNPKSGKFYTIVDVEEGANPFRTVYDDKNILAGKPYKVDKKGRAYKVANVEFKTLKNGSEVANVVEDAQQ